MFRLILTILVIIIGGFVYGQEAPNLSFTRYGIEDGLPNMTMDVLGQDSVGYIWLANPLTRFDGKNFKTFREQADDETSRLISAVTMTDDGEGNLFFASREGIYYYDTVQQYVKKIPSIPYNFSNRYILKTDANTFWDYSHYNLCKIDLPNFDTTHIHVPELRNVHFLYAKSGDSKIWIIQNQSCVKQLDLKTFKLHEYTSETVNDLGLAHFVIGKDMRAWIISQQGILMFDETRNEFVDFLNFDEVLNDKNWSFKYSSFQLGNNCWWIIDRLNHIVYKMNFNSNQLHSIKIKQRFDYDFNTRHTHYAIETADGSLVQGTTKEGLFTINPLNGIIRQYLPEANNTNSLFNNAARPEYSIDENSFLISGLGQGIIKADIKNPLFDTYIPPMSKRYRSYSKNIRSIVEWKGDIIVGSISGINLFNRKEKTFAPLPMPGDLPSPHPEYGTMAITRDKLQNLLITYWHQSPDAKIYYMDYINNRILELTDYFPETSHAASYSLFSDSKNNFWIAAQSGVIKLSADFLAKGNLETIREQAIFYSFKKFQPSGQDVHKVFTISEDRNEDIWVGTSSGLFRINQKTESIDAFKNSPENKTSLSSNDVRSIITSADGHTWVGTSNGGLNKYVEETNSFERYSTNEGLPDNTIYTIAEDEENKLWLGTNKGLCWFDPNTLQGQQYSPEDGVQSFEFNTNAVCKTSDNWLLFGGINGFNMFSPSEISSDASSKNLVLTSFKVNNKDYPSTTRSLDLAHNENFISFEFSLLEYFKNDKIQYAYKLEGLEKDWNYIKSAQKVSYPGLNPGTYTFKVKAASHNGLWSKKEISMPLFISYPWWKSWWFILLSTSLIVGMIYAFYRNKQNQKEKIIDLRNRISRDLHDEIGSTLSSISLFGTVAQKLAVTDTDGTQDMLSRINDSTTQVMESMNDIVWAINSDNDKVDNLLMRMRAYISELSDASEVKVSLEIDKGLKGTILNMVQRRNVYLIFKEATNNAFKYSQAAEIKVSLIQIKNRLQLSVIDNGIGFDQSTMEQNSSLSGNGLKNMANRAKELGGVLNIISEENQDTEIRFTWNPKTEPSISQNR
ncbi:MAG: ligand-binding sensor domain-containing protein [Halioglobus sp.]|jgi:ligand-binding sensor domain-containing protein